jgi:hypothetical protein
MFKYALSAALALALLMSPLLPAVGPAYGESTTAKPPTAAQTAARERQKQCGAEWKEAKAAGKIEKGMTWSKFYSKCNKRLKGA